MKIQCTGCTRVYEFNDDIVHKVYRKRLVCTTCKSETSIESALLDKESMSRLAFGEPLKQDVLGNLKKLCPTPHVLVKVRALLTGEGNFKELESLLNADPALAGRVLKVANSSYYGMRGKVSSLQLAASLLGSDTLLQIITLVANSKMLGRSLPGYGQNSGDLWKHSLAVAVCAQIVEETLHPQEGEDAFFAGLMHDAGKIILDTYVLERKAHFTRYTELTRASMNTAEMRILGFNHADIGYELCRKWNLPEPLGTAIKHHHSPTDFGANRLAYILNLADHMARSIAAEPTDPLEPPLDALHFLPISEIELTYLNTKAEEALERLEEETY